jgi:GTPase SAR1 family protein
MNEFKILVYAPCDKVSREPKLLTVTQNMSLSEFRRLCSDAHGFDAISIFSVSRKRITDISEIENLSEVLVFESFYPTCNLNSSVDSTNHLNFNDNSGSRNSISLEKKLLILKVETLGPQRSGKTSLIWHFMKNDSHYGENQTITEAVFEKDIDFLDQKVHFSIHDIKESEDHKPFEDRIVGKDVLLFCVSQTELVDSKDWINWSIRKVKSLNPTALIVLVLTKSDLKYSQNTPIHKEVLNLGVLIINTSIYENYMSGDIKSSDEVFSIIADHSINKYKGPVSLKGAQRNPYRQSVQTRKEKAEIWYMKPIRNIVSCFGRG